MIPQCVKNFFGLGFFFAKLSPFPFSSSFRIDIFFWEGDEGFLNFFTTHQQFSHQQYTESLQMNPIGMGLFWISFFSLTNRFLRFCIALKWSSPYWIPFVFKLIFVRFSHI